jgi:hypothetical protein
MYINVHFRFSGVNRVYFSVFSDFSTSITVTAFRANVCGRLRSNYCVDLAVGVEWEVSDGTVRTEERDAVQWSVITC